MLRRFLFVLALGLSSLLTAQTDVGLIAHYTFDGSLVDQTGNSANTGVELGDPEYDCGINGTSILLDGQGDAVVFPQGQINEEFDDEDFTVSMYFKATALGGVQYLLAKIDSSCNPDRRLTIAYRPDTRVLNIFMSENLGQNIIINYPIRTTSCWNLLTLTREGTEITLYINGEFAERLMTNNRVNIYNDGSLVLGSSPCLQTGETAFRGFIDDFRVYNRALNRLEVRDLYTDAPDLIVSRDTVIFLGDAVPVRTSHTCVTSFSWMPTDGVMNPGVPNTSITPSRSGVLNYFLSFRDNNPTCQASDSIRITVIDPSTLDCRKIYFPTAFTPNADNLNDEFGLSNPLAIDGQVTFEIYDRWGSIVFSANEPEATWDGTLGGEPVLPGVYLYRLAYDCMGEELVVTGGVTLLR